MRKKFVLVGCDSVSVPLLLIFGKENIAYFCDDNHQGEIVAGIEVINSQELKAIHQAYDILLVNESFADSLVEMHITFKRVFGTGEFFNLWQNLYQLSLRGMNFGGGSNVFTSGEFATMNILRDNIGVRNEPVIFDVGANIGNYTALLMTVFPNAQIHSFEPAKETFSNLQKNIAPNLARYSGKVQLNNFGLSDSPTKATLHYDQLNSGIASLYNRQLDYFGIDYSKSETVELSTLDNYCAENNIDRIDFLKMDVEGHELSVLKGSAKMLAESRIDNIQIEFGGCNLDSRTYVRDFWNLLHDKFRMFYMLADSLREIVNYQETLEVFTTTNYFFHKRSVGGRSKYYLSLNIIKITPANTTGAFCLQKFYISTRR